MSDMEFLKNIDWQNHDGVNIGMINDYMRNQFYDRVLATEVNGCTCTDIGFGTGLLSMIALKYGAKNVRAFESDHDRYLLGKEIIKRLNLSSRIDLINEMYDNDCTPTEVTFTETVNGNLWWEGLWCSLPRNKETKFLPSEYFLEIWATEIPDAFALGITLPQESNQYFNPGIDIDDSFIKVVNQLAKFDNLAGTSLLTPGIVKFARQQETVWGWIPYLRASQTGTIVANYSISNFDPNANSKIITIDATTWKDKNVVLVPRVGMQHLQHRMYLDTGHWGPCEDPVIVVKSSGRIQVKHSFRRGTISYNWE
jgi:hypothetical protein